MTRDQQQIIQALCVAWGDHIARHRCARVDNREAEWGNRLMGPRCATEHRVCDLISQLRHEFEAVAVHCAVCGGELPADDQLSYGDRLAHFACAAKSGVGRRTTRRPSSGTRSDDVHGAGERRTDVVIPNGRGFDGDRGVPARLPTLALPDEAFAAPPFQFTGLCAECGQFIAGGGTVHRECSGTTTP